MSDAKQQSVEAIEHLKKFIQPGATIYTVLRHVSRSGMSRNIDLYLIHDNEPMWISAYVGKAIGRPQSYKNWERSQGLTVQGCGMDMGFELVYSLGRAMFPEGFGEPCRKCKRRAENKNQASEWAALELDRTKDNLPYIAMCLHATKEDNNWAHEFYGRNGDTSGWDNDGGYALNHKWL